MILVLAGSSKREPRKVPLIRWPGWRARRCVHRKREAKVSISSASMALICGRKQRDGREGNKRDQKRKEEWMEAELRRLGRLSRVADQRRCWRVARNGWKE